MEEYRIDCIAGILHHAGFHLDAMLPQKRNAFSSHLVVWIITSNIDFFYAVFHDGKRTWGLFAIMTAWLQRYIHFRACCILGKTCKCCPFCMQIPISCMIPLSDDPVVLHDHRTDKRIRIDRAGSFFRLQLYPYSLIQTILSALESHQIMHHCARAIPPVGNHTPPRVNIYLLFDTTVL